MVEARAEILPGYIRVTDVLGYFTEPGLVDWMIKKGADHKKLAKQAMKVGTEVDNAIKLFVSTGSYGKVKTVEAGSCLEGFKRWYEDYKPNLTVGERLYDDHLKITGEPDLYMGDAIIDIKCASSVRPKYHLQTAAYCKMAQKPRTAILRLHKHLDDYEFVERTVDEVESDYDCFYSLLEVYKYFNKTTAATGGKEDGNADNITDDKERDQF